MLFELWYGAAKSFAAGSECPEGSVFFSGPVTVLAFDDSDSRAAGSIRAALEVSGRPIGAYDLLIAGQAMAREMILVTANLKEFSRVKGLKWVEWAKSRS